MNESKNCVEAEKPGGTVFTVRSRVPSSFHLLQLSTDCKVNARAMKAILLVCIVAAQSAAFLPASRFRRRDHALFPTTRLLAKKKKNRESGGNKGFGKVDPQPSSAATLPSASEQEQATQPASPFLQSVESGGSDTVPAVEEIKMDPDSSAEDRAKQVLREKYGMKTMAEQRLDEKQLENMKERQKQMAEWREKSEKGEEFDFMAMIPAPVAVAIDRFLKAGIAVTGVLFIASGLAMTIEAWSKSSGEPLPEDIDAFITGTIEPNFTYGLLVLLGFSISLGLFSMAQMTSDGAQYKENE